MSGDEHAHALDRFVAELNRVWRAAGAPDFADMEKLSRRLRTSPQSSRWRILVLATAGTRAVLTGQSRSLPEWRWVVSFLTVLRVAAIEAGIDAEMIGTLEEWKAKHGPAAATLRRAHGVAERQTGRTGNESPRPGAADLPGVDGDSGFGGLIGAVGLAHWERPLRWWHAHRDLIPEWYGVYLSLESAACLIRGYHTQVVPELLQTEEYARTALRLRHPDAAAAEIARRVELLMQRQRILRRPDAATLWVIIDETALRHQLGDAKIMRAQLQHLVHMSAETNITIQVLPSNIDRRAVAGGPISVLRFPEWQLGDVVYLEILTGGIYPESPADINYHIEQLNRLGIAAEKPAATQAIMRRLLTEL